MTQSSPQSEDSGKYLSTGEQEVGITDSRLNDSQIGGQAGRDQYQYQSKDFNDNSVNIVNQYINWQDKQEILRVYEKQESNLKTQFQERLEKVSALVATLRSRIQKQLISIPAEDREQILKLVSELQQLTAHESALENIHNKLKFCMEASFWLDKEQKHIAQAAANYVMNTDTLDWCAASSHQLGADELKARFERDIDSYLSWVGKYLWVGKKPRPDFKIEQVSLDLPSNAYKDAFLFILDNLVVPSHSKLSGDAATMLASYLNRFLVREEVQKDMFTKNLK